MSLKLNASLHILRTILIIEIRPVLRPLNFGFSVFVQCCRHCSAVRCCIIEATLSQLFSPYRDTIYGRNVQEVYGHKYFQLPRYAFEKVIDLLEWFIFLIGPIATTSFWISGSFLGPLFTRFVLWARTRWIRRHSSFCWCYNWGRNESQWCTHIILKIYTRDRWCYNWNRAQEYNRKLRNVCKMIEHNVSRISSR